MTDTFPFTADISKATEQATQQGREFAEQAAQKTREFAEQAATQTRELTAQAVAQTRELADKAITASRSYGNLALDSYEQTLQSLVELEQRSAEAAQVEWVKTAVGAHAAFVNDMGTAYVKAARDILA